MNILEKILNFFGIGEKRAEDSETTMVSFDSGFFNALVGAGNPITKQKALEIPAVQFCIELLSGLISALPVKLYEEAEDGKVTEIKNDVRVRLLNGDTGDTLNGTMFRRLWVRDYFLGGGAYAYIERDIYGMPAALYYVDESRLSTISNCKAIFKDYSVSVDGSIYPKSDFLKILRNSRGNGKGAGIVSESGTMLATAYNTMLYENSIVKKGGNKKGFFTSQNQQTKEAMQAIKEAWGKMNSTSQGVEDNVAVLNAGMDFKEVSLSSMDMQLNQNKQTNSGEVCGIFGVPPSMMSGTESSEAKKNFITDTLTPLINIFETAFDSDLLLETEKGKRYFAFDTRELTRGDILQRYQAYAIGKEKGFIQIDDIRKLEDMPPLNIPFVNLGLGDVLYNPETMEIYTPNTDKVINIRNLGWSLGENDNDASEENLDNSEELRYNPYHDPTNGRFTTSSGGGMGAVLHVPMGAKGKGEYVISSNFEDPENRKNMVAKERGVKNYKENQTFHIAKPNGTFEEMNGDTFEFGGREFGIHNIYGFTAGNFAVTDTKTGFSVGWYHTPKEAVSGIRKKINAIKSFKNLDAAESALDAYLDVKASKRAGELRFNPNHDPENGQFTSGQFANGNFSSSAIRFSGGGSSKGLTTGGKDDIIKATAQQRQDIKNILKGTKTPDGIIISNVSQHAADRIIERGYSADDVKKSLTDAAITYPGNTPGTHCVQFKADDRIVYNDKGNVVTIVKLGKEGNYYEA